MNILGISGSPKESGNTAYAVNYALDIVQDKSFKTKYITLAGRKIGFCRACWKCQQETVCIQKDDMEEVYEAMRWCDGLIIGSPVYMGMVSGQLKAMMDRCVVFRPGYDKALELSGKVGAGISCGGFRNGGQETALQNIHTFLLQQNMMVINDGAGFSHAGGTICGEAVTDKLGLSTIENLVTNLKLVLGKGK